MCNLYNITTNQAAIIDFGNAIRDASGNLEPSFDVYPGYDAPIVRNGADGVRELVKASWGMPSPQFTLMQSVKKRAAKLEAKGQAVDFKQLLRMEPDTGQTNIRNIASKHWTRWLGVENRCVVPFTTFSEYSKAHGGDVWFALDKSEPLAFFAGIYVPQWTRVRTIKQGETTKDLFGFLTTEPNAEVGAIHPKAMPVILRTNEEIDRWMSAPLADVPKLQQPLPDGSLLIVEKAKKQEAGLLL